MILTGWKEISKHLRFGIRTLQRWEDNGLPVKRVKNSPRSPVVADTEELDAWILHRNQVLSGKRQAIEDNLRRTRELQQQLSQNRQVLQQRLQALRKELAELRAKRRKMRLTKAGALRGDSFRKS